MRVSYTPGSWLVLAGANSVVVLEKLPETLEGRVAELWESTLGHGSPDALFAFLSQAGLTQVEHLGAFFLDEDRLHGIARGDVRVVDEETHDIVLEGSGALTWREQQLDVHGTYRVTLAAMDPTAQTLPLVVGAATVSSLVVTADDVHVAQFTDDREADAEVELLDEPVGEPDIPTDEPAESPVEAMGFVPPVIADFDQEPDRDSDIEEPVSDGEADQPEGQEAVEGESAQSEEPTAEADDYFRPAPVLASVASNQDHRVDLDVDVIVGRSPDPAHGSQGAFLMRVVSPSNDISRSHLKVAQEGWDIVVRDLNSTNGTMIKPPGAKEFELHNGESTNVEVGTILDLGDGVSLRIEPALGRSAFAPPR